MELAWGSPRAEVAESGGGRSGSDHLRLPGQPATLGHFALGTMRWERDLQYQGRHLAPFDSTLPPVPELVELIQGLARLDGAERARHLKILAGSSLESLRSRLHPATRLLKSDSVWTVRVEQPSFDARDRLLLPLGGSGQTPSGEAGAGPGPSPPPPAAGRARGCGPREPRLAPRPRPRRARAPGAGARELSDGGRDVPAPRGRRPLPRVAGRAGRRQADVSPGAGTGRSGDDAARGPAPEL